MQDDTQKIIEEQFQSLPKVVRDAIVSGHIEEKFQALAKKYQLHLDEWQKVENLIMFSVLGLVPPETLVDRIVSETNIGRERADSIVDDISLTVFKPIREELERELGHPQAQEEVLSDIDQMREQVLAGAPATVPASSAPTTPLPQPATPPSPPPTEKVVRMPASGAYKPGETSTVRGDIHDDPYREPPA